MNREYVLLTGEDMRPFTVSEKWPNWKTTNKFDNIIGRFTWAVLVDGEFLGETVSASVKPKHIKSGEIIEKFNNIDKQLKERASQPEEKLLELDLNEYYILWWEQYEDYRKIRGPLLNIIHYLTKNDIEIENIFNSDKTLTKKDFDELFSKLCRLMPEELKTPYSEYGRQLEKDRRDIKYRDSKK